MNDAHPLLRVRDLSTKFFTKEGTINAADKISFDVNEGEILSIVGESGSGKSVTGRSLLGLIESPGKIVNGEIWYRSPSLREELDGDMVDGEYINLLSVSSSIRSSLLGKDFSMIFQDPEESFNQSLTVGRQIAEAVEVNKRAENGETYSNIDLLKDIVTPGAQYISEESYDRAVELLKLVDIPDYTERADEYPHQFSGGMLQRAMIAQAIACDPEFLVADEPTTGLDVTIQAGVINLLKNLQNELDLTVLLITHNLGVVSRLGDRTAVMYAGELFEVGPTDKVLNSPENPYTEGLLNSLPDLTDSNKYIEPISGNVPSLLDSEMGLGCSFADRCPAATDECTGSPPPTRAVNGDSGHRVTCLHAGDGDTEVPISIETNPTREEPRQDTNSKNIANND
ncbi:ABC transporter ATP-binding protein [Natronomonas salsuginis]|uniref:Nickel import system ATP-binding protein NikD n=1 Tax=Natronomonas salsuginis TaxID=2217661 RepID=A0A4U5J8G3_9EURY|nr:ABC transporter ATP-binding protein [Natronomonas salsuginis]TKR24481.1 ABC transporter ATP-binding protein [Natronomonas salsuginis]